MIRELHRRFGLFVVHMVIIVRRDRLQAIVVIFLRYLLEEVQGIFYQLLGSLDETLGSVGILFD